MHAHVVVCLLGNAVRHAGEFVSEVEERVKAEEGVDRKQTHNDCRENVQELIECEQAELQNYGGQCIADLSALSKSFKT